MQPNTVIPAPSHWIAALQLTAAVVICESAGVIGALLTDTGQSPWYQTLNKPSFTPPGWVFGPVWTILYLLMGIATFLIWRAGWQHTAVKWALIAFAIQLLLNAVWTPIFFGLHSPTGGFVVIVILWLAIAATIILFYPISRLAGILLIPYLLWASFAAVLNGAIVMLNRNGSSGL